MADVLAGNPGASLGDRIGEGDFRSRRGDAKALFFPLETPMDRMYNNCDTVYYMIDIIMNMLLVS